MTHSDKKYHYVDSIGLVLIGALSLGYVIFPKIAERHLQLPFLNFPIFLGEILLFGCLILFCVKYRHNPSKLTKWHYWIICYFIFVLTKALCGYLTWWPLALRHAALLYYPVFAIFSYAFYRRKLFDWKACSLLPLLIISIFLANENDFDIIRLLDLKIIWLYKFRKNLKCFKLGLGYLTQACDGSWTFDQTDI